jgi:hypothetical protein
MDDSSLLNAAITVVNVLFDRSAVGLKLPQGGEPYRSGRKQGAAP